MASDIFLPSRPGIIELDTGFSTDLEERPGALFYIILHGISWSVIVFQPKTRGIGECPECGPSSRPGRFSSQLFRPPNQRLENWF